MNMKSQEPVVYELDLSALFESAMDRRLGQDPATQEKTRTVQNYAKKERDELKGLVDKILEDGVLDAEERVELGHLEQLESMTSELFDKVNLENPELSQEFEAAGEQFRQKLIALVRKGKTKEESIMKKSELMKIIREEVEVVLTNAEAVEMFDLDPAALIDEMLEEEDLEEEKKPSSGLSKKQKSNIAKKASAGEDIGKKGKGFKKVADKAAERYGSKEAGKRVAAAAMWKNAKR